MTGVLYVSIARTNVSANNSTPLECRSVPFISFISSSPNIHMTFDLISYLFQVTCIILYSKFRQPNLILFRSRPSRLNSEFRHPLRSFFFASGWIYLKVIISILIQKSSISSLRVNDRGWSRNRDRIGRKIIIKIWRF